MLFTFAFVAILSNFALHVLGETHTVTFTNNCGYGTPKLIQGSNILSNGSQYTANGTLSSVIAYLDNGKCNFNGEGCTTLELTLGNGGSGHTSADISLISPHEFSDAAGFTYTGGSCSGQGAFCGDASCNTAFFQPNDNCVQVQCEEDNAGIDIIFCGGSTHFTDASQKGVPCS